MRGSDQRSEALFSYVNIEGRVPAGHPLRVIRAIANEALASMSGGFDRLYASPGRPSVPPEMLLRALLLQVAREPVEPRDDHGQRAPRAESRAAWSSGRRSSGVAALAALLDVLGPAGALRCRGSGRVPPGGL